MYITDVYHICKFGKFILLNNDVNLLLEQSILNIKLRLMNKNTKN